MPRRHLTLRDELKLAFQRALQEIIPDPPNRIPLTWRTAPHSFAYVVPLLFMAYLSRRRDTQIMRLLLLPTTIFLAVRGTFAYDAFNPDYYFYTWVRGLAGLTAIGMALDFALSQTDRMKVGERTLPAINEPERVPTDDDNAKGLVKPSNSSYFPKWYLDAMDALCSMRGIDWNFGKGVYVPPETRPLERNAWLKATFKLFLFNFIVGDFCETVIKLIPGIGDTTGGSLFRNDLPPFSRYVVSTVYMLLAAFTLSTGMAALTLGIALVGVGILGQSPTQWPPLIDNPWAAQSVSEFWAKRWHQALRRTFIIFGGIPGEYLFGRLGRIMGTFLASGLFHEFGTYLMGRGMDHRVTMFFVIQGVAVVLEWTFKKVTGKRVGGFLGRIWTYFFILGLGQMCIDAWFERGLAGALIVPPAISPSRRIIIPTLRRLFASRS
ncbi:hypothetical protein K474DRAFT_1713707 [Panus rudis PR-1116 ss-1]|nr:hypothetical protein K474DRAFT_1713707 [Panus rudis PR-1116 ss-1]